MPLPESLPCVRGGAAQRRKGWKVCGIFRYRAIAPGSQPLSRLRRQLPLHRGACLCSHKQPLPGNGIKIFSLFTGPQAGEQAVASKRWDFSLPFGHKRKDLPASSRLPIKPQHYGCQPSAPTSFPHIPPHIVEKTKLSPKNTLYFAPGQKIPGRQKPGQDGFFAQKGIDKTWFYPL